MDPKNRFSYNPANLDIPRSLFSRDYSRYQTMDSGKLVPFMCDIVLPSDSVTIDTNVFTRMSKPILPTMQPLYQDVFYFFVPMRLVWLNYKQFFGENDLTAWTRSSDKVLPHLDPVSISNMASEGTYYPECLLDYLGVHLGCDDGDSNNVDSDGDKPLDILNGLQTLPIRAYQCVWNEWFRDENYDAPAIFTKGDSGQFDWLITWFGSTSQQPVHRDGVLPVRAFHDYFTSTLPAPQKGPNIIPIGDGFFPTGVSSGSFPVTADPVAHLKVGDDTTTAIKFAKAPDTGTIGNIGTSAGVGLLSGKLMNGSVPTGYSDYDPIAPTNLYARLPADVFASVDQIRYSFALKRFYEKDARGGNRYREKIKAHFGCTGSDSSMMVPEYLGGRRFALNMDTILTTADTSDGSTGEYAGYSKTFENLGSFSKSFTEHGFIIGLTCVRAKNVYFQGMRRFWKYKDQLDFYWPSFANLGEQPEYNWELYADGTKHGGSFDPEGVIGYNEAYAEYRHAPDEVCGKLRPTATGFMAGYTYANKLAFYTANAAAIRETPKGAISQNLAVPSGPMFITNFSVQARWRRSMPVYSVPGLVDHH